MPKPGQCDYSSVVEIDLSKVTPTVAGPKLPNQRIPLPGLKERFHALMEQSAAEGGYGKGVSAIGKRVAVGKAGIDVGHGDVLIAATFVHNRQTGGLLGAGLRKKAGRSG